MQIRVFECCSRLLDHLALPLTLFNILLTEKDVSFILAQVNIAYRQLRLSEVDELLQPPKARVGQLTCACRVKCVQGKLGRRFGDAVRAQGSDGVSRDAKGAEELLLYLFQATHEERSSQFVSVHDLLAGEALTQDDTEEL